MRTKFTLVMIFALTLVLAAMWQVDTAKCQYVTNGLISYWSFDQSTITGTTAKDLKGVNNGTLMGSPQVVAGKVGQALKFNGSTDYVDCGDDASLQATTGLTMEAWINIADFPGGTTNTVITKWDDDSHQRGYMFNFGEGGEAGAAANEIGVVITESGTWDVHFQWGTKMALDTDQWYHIAITLDSTLATGNVKAYLNGAFKSEKDWAHKIWPSTAKLLIGGYDGPGNGLNGGSNSRWTNGMIDEVRIYSRALNAGEVTQNFNSVTAVNPTSKLALSWGKIKAL